MALAGLRRGLRRSSLFGRPSPAPAQTHNADVAPPKEETREKDQEKSRQSELQQMEAVGPAGSASVATSTTQEEQQHRYPHSILIVLLFFSPFFIIFYCSEGQGDDLFRERGQVFYYPWYDNPEHNKDKVTRHITHQPRRRQLKLTHTRCAGVPALEPRCAGQPLPAGLGQRRPLRASRAGLSAPLRSFTYIGSLDSLARRSEPISIHSWAATRPSTGP